MTATARLEPALSARESGALHPSLETATLPRCLDNPGHVGPSPAGPLTASSVNRGELPVQSREKRPRSTRGLHGGKGLRLISLPPNHRCHCAVSDGFVGCVLT